MDVYCNQNDARTIAEPLPVIQKNKMSPDLLVETVKYKNYFLVISGIYGGRILTVLDNQLNKVSEHDFSGIQMWDEEFHIDEESSKILISVTTTETFPLENKKYQGFPLSWPNVRAHTALIGLNGSGYAMLTPSAQTRTKLASFCAFFWEAGTG